MSGIANFFRELYEKTGFNLTVAYDPFDRARFLHSILMTMELAGICVICSVIVGIMGAWLQGSSLVWTRRFVQGYIQFFRNTPPLVQLYFFYFGLSSVLPTVTNSFSMNEPLISGFVWACISLTLFAGAFNVEIFRSGIEAVPTSTVEAAEALGYTRFRAFIHVVLPLAVRVCLPALNNNLVNLVKTTTLAYAIAVPELLYTSSQIWSESSNVLEMMTLLLAVYVALVGLLVFGMKQLERVLRRPGLGV